MIEDHEIEKPKFVSTIINPADFALSSKLISPINCPNIVNDFKFIIGETSYDTNKNLARSVFHYIDDQLIQNKNISSFLIDIPDPNFDFQAIQALLAGNTITINEKNAYFLYNIGTLLGCQDLVDVTLPFQKRYRDTQLISPTSREKAYSLFVSFFTSFTTIMRIILFLCELIGYAVAFGFCFNFAMVPITSGIISPTIPDFYRWALMFPFLFFQINVINLLSLVTYYLCEFNFFRSKTFLPKHLHLLKIIGVVWPFCKEKDIQDFSDLNINLNSALVSVDQNNSPNNSSSSTSSNSSPRISTHHKTSAPQNSRVYDIILGISFFIILSSFFINQVFKYVMLTITIYIPVF